MQAGDYVISRGRDSGVFAGTLEVKKGQEVELSNARRIWYWEGAASLSELSQKGVKYPSKCKFPMEVPLVIQADCIELLPVSEEAQASIREVPTWSA